MAVCDPTERAIINGLQGGFPLTHEPYRAAGANLGLSQGELLDGLAHLIENGSLSRFGPLWNPEGLGGAVCLCALAVPAERFDAVAAKVNAHPEVAHNYERTHRLNMWFVISVENPEGIEQVICEIERETGLDVYRMPKLREFFVGFHIEV